MNTLWNTSQTKKYYQGLLVAFNSFPAFQSKS